jgi:hypothetical protein
MIMRWFIGLVFLCLSLVAHGREVEPTSGADLALSPYKDEIAAGDNVILKEVVAGVQALQVTSSLVVTPAAFAKSAQNFTKVQSVLRSADKLTSATKLKTAKLIQGLQDSKSACWGLMGSHASKLGNTKAIDFTKFGFSSKDAFYDIVIHFKDGKYVVHAEFETVEKSLEEIADIIDNVPTGKTARLLTCNDASANLALSTFTTKPFYGSDGVVEITQDGLVHCDKKFYKYSNGNESRTEVLDYTNVKNTNAQKSFYKLGDVVQEAGNRFFRSIDDFKDAIARGENVFYVGKHSDITPRPTGVQSHHGINTVWMDAKYSNYSMNNAPSVYMLNNPNHNATRGIFNTWRSEIAIQQGVSITNVNYSLVTKDEILRLAERQFDAADVPKVVRDEYYKLWDDYLKTLTTR